MPLARLAGTELATRREDRPGAGRWPPVRSTKWPRRPQVVLEAAAVRRVVRRRDDDSVRRALRRALGQVVRHDGARHDRRRGGRVSRVQHHLDAVRRQHLQRGRSRRFREGVRVPAEKEGPPDALRPAIGADRLGDGQDMPLVEAELQRGAAVPRRPEGHALLGDLGVGPLGEIGGDELGHVDQDRRRRGLSCEWIDLWRAHGEMLAQISATRSLTMRFAGPRATCRCPPVCRP
jgi:hypothetical protein